MADIFDTIRDQMSAAEMAAGSLHRIIIDPWIPQGNTFLLPYEEDGGEPGPHRTVGNGPVELRISPADWERLVRTMGGPSDSPLTPSVGSLMGIPVIRESNG